MKRTIVFLSLLAIFGCSDKEGINTPCDYLKAYSKITEDETEIRYYTDSEFKNLMTGCYCEKQNDTRQVHHKTIVKEGRFVATYNFQTSSNLAPKDIAKLDSNALGQLLGSTIVEDNGVEHQTWYHENGAIAYTGDSKVRKKLGIHKEFNEEGNLITERDYDYENPIDSPEEYLNQDEYENRNMYEKKYSKDGNLITEGAFAKVTNAEMAAKIPLWYMDGFSRYHEPNTGQIAWIRDGKHIWYNNNNEIDSTVVFTRGKRE